MVFAEPGSPGRRGVPWSGATPLEPGLCRAPRSIVVVPAESAPIDRIQIDLCHPSAVQIRTDRRGAPRALLP